MSRYALVSPLEPRDGGYRVTNIEDEPFEVAKPWFWVECPDDARPDEWVFHDPDGETVAAVKVAPDHDEDRKRAIPVAKKAAMLSPAAVEAKMALAAMIEADAKPMEAEPDA